jgi:hypothetical protein
MEHPLHDNIIWGHNTAPDMTSGHHNIIIGDGIEIENDSEYIFAMKVGNELKMRRMTHDEWNVLHGFFYEMCTDEQVRRLLIKDNN